MNSDELDLYILPNNKVALVTTLLTTHTDTLFLSAVLFCLPSLCFKPHN
jgi:hypothetical protein